jgi:hypothetical protein
MSKNSSYGNGHVLRAFDVTNATLSGTGKYSTPYVDVSEFQNFNMVVWNNNASLTVTFRFSTNGTNDLDKKIDIPQAITAEPELQDIGTFGIKAKYLCIDLAGTPAQIATFQLVFRDAPVGTQNDLTNIGAGIQVLKEPDEMRTLKSSDASVLITEGTTEIDFTVAGLGTNVTLSNAGVDPGTETLVNDGIGPLLAVKGLVGGSGVTLSTNTTDITINSSSSDVVLSSAGGTEGLPVDTIGPTISVKGLNAGSGITLTPSAGYITIASTGGSSPYQQIGSVISPVSANSAIASGLANVINSTNGFIGGGNNCTINPSNGAIVGSSSSSITDSQRCGIYSSSVCTISTSTNAGENAILASENSNITRLLGAQNMSSDVIVGSEGSAIDNSFFSGIYSGQSHTINNGNRQAIVGGESCSITNCQRGSIFGSNGSDITTTTNCQTNVVVGGQTNSIINGAGSVSLSVMLGGLNSTIDNCSLSTCIGTNAYVNRSGVLVCTDAGSGTGVTTSLGDQCTFRFINGYIYYTNSTNTTGAQMLAGASSWSSVCVREKKENIEEIMYNKILDKLEEVPIYKYNYIGNDPKQRNISPMADDWHEQFKFLDGGLKSKDVIESMDAIGVSLACIKALHSEVKENYDKFGYHVRETVNDNLRILKTIEHIEDENENNLNVMVDYIKDVKYEMNKKTEELDEKIDILTRKFDQKDVNSTNIKLERRIHDLEKRLKFLENQH